MYRKGLYARKFHIEDPRSGQVTFHSRADFLQRQQERRDRIKQKCALNKNYGKAKIYSNVITDEKRRVVYCRVTKAASNFFKRLLSAAHEELPIETPFDIGLPGIKLPSRSLPQQTSTRDRNVKSRNVLQKYHKVLFVREPFSRMFSAYVDKLFAPNPVYWDILGRKIIKAVRKHPSRDSLMCGHDVRFDEVVKYVITLQQTRKTQDMHFVPTYTDCAVCSANYTFIGKMETLMQDTAFLLEILGQNVSKTTLDTWVPRFIEDAIMDSSFSPFGWEANISRCVSFYEAAKRIWHKLQIRGIISKHSKMPYDKNSISSVRASQFIETLFKYRQDPVKAKEQKNEAIRKVFSTVPKEDIDAYRRLFRPDFELFGYDMYSEYLFPAAGVPKDSSNWVFDLENV